MLEGPPGRHHPLPSARTEGGITPGSLSQAWGGRRSYVKEFLDKFFKSFRGNWADQMFHPTLGRTGLLPPKEMSSDST